MVVDVNWCRLRESEVDCLSMQSECEVLQWGIDIEGEED